MGKVHASLFSGFGAADLAATWMGWDNAFWCEIDDFPRTVLSYWFPKSKGYGNIKETDFSPWRGKIDVLTGGFPCQPFSVAGQRKGQEDERYLWPEMLRAIREIRPTWIIGENVGGIISMVQPGSEITVESQASLFEEADKETLLEQEYVVETVCRDLEQEGYSVQPVVIPACAIRAPHRRDRIFFIAYCTDARFENLQERKDCVCEFESPSDSNSNDAGRSRYEQVRCKAGKSETSEGKRERVWSNTKRACKEGITPDSNGAMLEEWFKTGRRKDATETTTGMDNGTKRSGSLWYAPHAHQLNGYLSGFRSGWISQFEASEIRIDTDTYNKRFTKQCLMSEPSKSGFTCGIHNETRRDWQNFPTQSPVCRGNDGLPFDVVRLTVSLTAWFTGSIKGYGNAIVPQVMYEIFKAIEESEKQFKSRKN